MCRISICSHFRSVNELILHFLTSVFESEEVFLFFYQKYTRPKLSISTLKAEPPLNQFYLNLNEEIEISRQKPLRIRNSTGFKPALPFTQANSKNSIID